MQLPEHKEGPAQAKLAGVCSSESDTLAASSRLSNVKMWRLSDAKSSIGLPVMDAQTIELQGTLAIVWSDPLHGTGRELPCTPRWAQHQHICSAARSLWAYTAPGGAPKAGSRRSQLLGTSAAA